MANPTRSLETDPRWLNNGLAEVCAASHVVHDPIPFLRDAKAAHHLLDLVVLAAGLFDQLISDEETPGWVVFRAEAIRKGMEGWLPLPVDRAGVVTFDAWILHMMTVLHSAGCYDSSLKVHLESESCPICRVCTLPGHPRVHAPGCLGDFSPDAARTYRVEAIRADGSVIPAAEGATGDALAADALGRVKATMEREGWSPEAGAEHG